MAACRSRTAADVVSRDSGPVTPGTSWQLGPDLPGAVTDPGNQHGSLVDGRLHGLEVLPGEARERSPRINAERVDVVGQGSELDLRPVELGGGRVVGRGRELGPRRGAGDVVHADHQARGTGRHQQGEAHPGGGHSDDAKPGHFGVIGSCGSLVAAMHGRRAADGAES